MLSVRHWRWGICGAGVGIAELVVVGVVVLGVVVVVKGFLVLFGG